MPEANQHQVSRRAFLQGTAPLGCLFQVFEILHVHLDGMDKGRPQFRRVWQLLDKRDESPGNDLPRSFWIPNIPITGSKVPHHQHCIG